MPTITEHITVDDTLIDGSHAYTIMDPVWCNATIYHDEKMYLESLAPFSTEQRLLHAVMWYRVEVNNGGHEQFYGNSAGIVWRDALAAFTEIGIEEAVSIIAESAKRLGGAPSMDWNTRLNALARLRPNFDDLDDRFYELEEQIDIGELMKEYILKHRASFYFDGEIQKWKPK